MAKRHVSGVPPAQTKAATAFARNLKSLDHILALTRREALLLKRRQPQLEASMANFRDFKTKPGAVKLRRSMERFIHTTNARIERLDTVRLWQVVVLVTCVEAYLQDILTLAAGVDGELMSKSEQVAPYSDVIASTSLDELANELRRRWARGWLSDGGPTRWISRLKRMGARGYPDDLGPHLELMWGIRHVVVHAAGTATLDFVKRHPGIVNAAGDRVPLKARDLQKFVANVRSIVEPTERFFASRYPSLVAAPEKPKERPTVPPNKKPKVNEMDRLRALGNSLEDLIRRLVDPA
jgi:hypothetical protein